MRLTRPPHGIDVYDGGHAEQRTSRPLAIDGLPCAKSSASMTACPILASISALPQRFEKWPSVDKEHVSASLGARSYMIIEGTLTSASGSLCCSPNRSVICTKFTLCRSLILSARFCRRTISLSWRVYGIFQENRRSRGMVVATASSEGLAPASHVKGNLNYRNLPVTGVQNTRGTVFDTKAKLFSAGPESP